MPYSVPKSYYKKLIFFSHIYEMESLDDNVDVTTHNNLLRIFGANSPIRVVVENTKDFTLTKYEDLLGVFTSLTYADVELLDMCFNWSGPIVLSEEQSDRLAELDQYLDLPVVKYLKFDWGIDLVNYVAKNGDLECLKYLHEHGCPWDEHTCVKAARYGHLDCLKYLHDQNCPWGTWACIATAYGGYLDCLKYLHEQGCPWDTWTCSYAAQGGRLDCLKYLHEQGCPWNEQACANAAAFGHLDCIKYLHEQGCPWDERTCIAAAEGGRLDCLKYLHEHGCPWNEEVYSMADIAGHLECLKYLRDNGCPRRT